MHDKGPISDYVVMVEYHLVVMVTYVVIHLVKVSSIELTVLSLTHSMALVMLCYVDYAGAMHALPV